MATTFNPFVQILTHIQDAIKRLSGQFRETVTFEGQIEIGARQIQDLEDVIFDVLDARTLANAEGLFLDQLGELVDQPREGFNDDFYRILIYVKIVENISEGQPSAIISAARLILQTISVQYMNLGNGNVALFTDGTLPPVTGSFLYQQLQRVLAGGVKLAYISTGGGRPRDQLFAFGSVTRGDPPIGLGFGNADGDPGGYWATVVPNDGTIIAPLEFFTLDDEDGNLDISPLDE